MGCYVVAEFLLTSASRSPSAIGEPLVCTRIVTTRRHAIARLLAMDLCLPVSV